MSTVFPVYAHIPLYVPFFQSIPLYLPEFSSISLMHCLPTSIISGMYLNAIMSLYALYVPKFPCLTLNGSIFPKRLLELKVCELLTDSVRFQYVELALKLKITNICVPIPIKTVSHCSSLEFCLFLNLLIGLPKISEQSV